MASERPTGSGAAVKRPAGKLLCLYALRPEDNANARALALRILAADPTISVLLCSSAIAAPWRKDRLFGMPPLAATGRAAESFLREWAPALFAWIGPSETALATEVDRKHVPTIMIDVAETDFPPLRTPWAKMKLRNRLKRVHRILTVSKAAATRVVSLGADPQFVESVGKLLPSPVPPAHDEAERTYLTDALGARPVWYAVSVSAAEARPMVATHEASLRRAHRSLAIISPETDAAAEAIRARAASVGLKLACRSETDEIDDEDQLLLADLPGEEGLWYRLAPQTFLGGSLDPGEASGCARSPLEPAALGSAILHGPHYGAHEAEFLRLRASGATEEINTPRALPIALGRISAPDRSAALAHAAWDIATRGAEVTDRIVGILMDAMADAEGQRG